jgi:hypothetical protein
MAEAPTQKINFLSKYLEGLTTEGASEGESQEPVAQVVRVLNPNEKRSVEQLHAATGLDYSELVPALKTLETLGLATIDEGDVVSLTAQGVLVKRDQHG